MATPTVVAYTDDEFLAILRQAMLAYCYKDTIGKLTLLQRSQRRERRTSLPVLPASLLRRRRSSTRDQATPERVLITGKTLPKLKTLLNEPDAVEKLDENLLNSLQYERDLDALRAAYEAAARELNEGNGSTLQLEHAISEFSGHNSEVCESDKHLRESKEQLKILQTELVQVKQNELSKLKYLDERIAEAKYNLKCVSRVNDLEYNLVERWEASRISQSQTWGENAERAYLREILDFKQRLVREARVSHELHKFRALEQAELQERIKQWQEKYATEMRRVDREAEAWEMRIIEVQKSLERHREIYEERVQFVAEYRQRQEEEQRLQDLQVHRMECAVRLQAWWRGTMVRRGLGPFKKKPKRGKRGKTKK